MDASRLAWDEVSRRCGSMTMYKFYLHTFFFSSSSWLFLLSIVIQLSKLLKKKKKNLTEAKKECFDFSTFTFNRLFTATDVRHQISHKASYKNIFWPAPPALAAPGGQRTLQKAPHKPRPAPVSHALKVHLSEIFPKNGSCCFYVAFLQAALTSVLLFVHAVVSIIRFVAVTRWRMYKGRWGEGRYDWHLRPASDQAGSGGH